MAAYKRLRTEHDEQFRLAQESKRARAVLEAKVRSYRAGIVGAEKQRDLMGDAWANATIEHYKALLNALGVAP